MRQIYAFCAVLVAAFLLAPQLRAQTVQMVGPVLNGGGHALMLRNVVPGGAAPYGLPQAMDSGPAGGGAQGLGLSEKLLQATTGPGLGTGPFGSHDCDWDTYALNSAGANYLCLDPNIGNDLAAIISSNPLEFIIQGRVYPYPPAITGLTSVATNIALEALSTSAASTIQRNDYAVGNGAPPEIFVASAAACTISGGDGGSQVPSADGRCWIGKVSGTGGDDREFGATCGTSDSTAALQAEANYFAANTGGTILIPCPQTIAGRLILGNATALVGNASMYYAGMLTSTWPPTTGPALNCTSLTVAQCVQLGGYGDRVGYLNIGNPLPTPPATGTYTPPVYPPLLGTVASTNWAGILIDDITFTGSQCIDLEGSPSYISVGIAGSQWTLRDLWMDPCLNQGIIEHDIDNTGRISNVDYDFWWNRNIPSLGAYVKAHSVGMTWEYAANTQLNNIEFFSNYKAIDQINSTVSGGFNATFAAANIQGTNISFNEVCQAMANESGTSLISTGRFSNVILYQDTTDPAVDCPLNSTSAIDLSASFGANWSISNFTVGLVQTIADVGPNSTLHMDNVDVQGYSYFASGGTAFKISAGADVSFGGSLLAAIRPATGTCPYGTCSAGNLFGPGLDSTQGYMQGLMSGGGTNAIEGSATLGGAGQCGIGQAQWATTTGCVFFDLPGGQQVGYVGVGTSIGVNLKATGSLNTYIGNSNEQMIVGGTATATGGHLAISVSNLPTTPPSGVGSGYICFDNAGNLYAKSSCP